MFKMEMEKENSYCCSLPWSLAQRRCLPCRWRRRWRQLPRLSCHCPLSENRRKTANDGSINIEMWLRGLQACCLLGDSSPPWNLTSLASALCHRKVARNRGTQADPPRKEMNYLQMNWEMPKTFVLLFWGTENHSSRSELCCQLPFEGVETLRASQTLLDS